MLLFFSCWNSAVKKGVELPFVAMAVVGWRGLREPVRSVRLILKVVFATTLPLHSLTLHLSTSSGGRGAGGFRLLETLEAATLQIISR